MTLRRLIIFDTTKPDSGRYIVANRPDNLFPYGTYNLGKWSPDNQAFVYKASNDELIYVSADTGETTLLDTSVQEIIAWVET